MLQINNKNGNKKKFNSELIYDVKNYKIFKLLDYDLFFIYNMKNFKNLGFILNDNDCNKELAYFYYNLHFKKVLYINDMNNDNEHQNDTKDMRCVSAEILCREKINKINELIK